MKGTNNVVDPLSRPVQLIQHDFEERWLGKSRIEIIQLQKQEPPRKELVEYLEGGALPT